MIPWTEACLAPLSMEFSRQEYWSGLPFPSPVDLPYPGTEPMPLASQANSLQTGPLRKPHNQLNLMDIYKEYNNQQLENVHSFQIYMVYSPKIDPLY